MQSASNAFINKAVARKRKRSAIGRFFYRFRYRLGEYALRGFVSSLPWIPRRVLLLYTSAMARLMFGILWQYRKRMQENLSVALGDSIESEHERKALLWRAWRNFAIGILDTGAVMHFSREQFFSTIILEGEEHLRRALARGKGVLALSAHLGGFTLIGGRLAASGYPFSAVVKHPADERFAQLMNDYRGQLGIQTISAKPRREAVRGILKALRENRIVLIIADEFKSGDVMVNFFGQRFPAPRGPASLALRTGAATLPMFAVRRSDGKLTLEVGAEIEPIRRDDVEESVVATTALFTRHLEEAIRKYPDQWNWLGFPRAGRTARSEMDREKSPALNSSMRPVLTKNPTGQSDL